MSSLSIVNPKKRPHLFRAPAAALFSADFPLSPRGKRREKERAAIPIAARPDIKKGV